MLLGPPGFNWCFYFAPALVSYLAPRDRRRWPARIQLVFLFCSGVSKLFGAQGSPSSGSLLNLCVLVFNT